MQYGLLNEFSLFYDFRYGMSCTKDPSLINRYIDYTLDTSFVRKQDQTETLAYIGSHENSKYVAWSYVINNWDKLIAQ